MLDSRRVLVGTVGANGTNGPLVRWVRWGRWGGRWDPAPKVLGEKHVSNLDVARFLKRVCDDIMF